MNTAPLSILAFSIFITVNLSAQIIDRDGNKYNTIKIGTQTWLPENLNVSHFRNGDSVPQIESPIEWQKAGKDGKPAWCYYNNDSAFGRVYHKLYNWYAVHDPRGLAPTGWHIPSTIEWIKLVNYLGGKNIAGGKIKSNSGWDYKGNGTNESGFTGIPSGYRNSDGSFDFIGSFSYWWSSSEYNGNAAHDLNISCGSNSVSQGAYYKENGYSVRCLKN